MSRRIPTQDLFFGDIDDINHQNPSMDDDTSSLRTPVATGQTVTTGSAHPSHSPTGPVEPSFSSRTVAASTQTADGSNSVNQSWRSVIGVPAPRHGLGSLHTPVTYNFLRDPANLADVEPQLPPWHHTGATRSENWKSSQETLVEPSTRRLDDFQQDVRPDSRYSNPSPTHLRSVPDFFAIHQAEDDSVAQRQRSSLAPPDQDDRNGNQDYENYLARHTETTNSSNSVMNGDTLGMFEENVATGGRRSPYYALPIQPEEVEPEPDAPTYSLAADTAMLQTAMSFIDFLPHDLAQPAELVVVTKDDGTFYVAGLDLIQLEERCPLLAMGFEKNRAGIYKNSLEAKSRLLAVSLLRFLCTGSYLVTADDGKALVASSLLFHAEMYQIADNFDLTDLKKEAQSNITRVTEFADSYPNPPEDLCDASRFIYAQLSKHTNLAEIIQHYCVNCFRRHNLKDNLTFRQLVDEVTLFGLDLLKTNIERGFKDDGAADIIQLPINTAPRTAQLEAEQLALVDFVYDIWGPRTFATRCGDDSDASDSSSSPRLQGYALVRRPKVAFAQSSAEQSGSEVNASEGEGFTLVHRLKRVKPSDVVHSADDADVSDWSESSMSDAEDLSETHIGKLPVHSTPSEAALSSSVATIRPLDRPSTPTQAKSEADEDDLFDSSDADFTVIKPRQQLHDALDDTDDFEML